MKHPFVWNWKLGFTLESSLSAYRSKRHWIVVRATVNLCYTEPVLHGIE